MRFYEWNLKNITRVPQTRQTSADEIVKIAEEPGGVMGDNSRVPGHTFMKVAYDKHLKKFWTVEGNFNNKVLIWKRAPSSLGLGRLTEDLIID